MLDVSLDCYGQRDDRETLVVRGYDLHEGEIMLLDESDMVKCLSAPHLAICLGA